MQIENLECESGLGRHPPIDGLEAAAADFDAGGGTGTIPFPEWLTPYLKRAMEASKGDVVFPAPSGKTRSEHTDAVAVIQTAMKAAGLVAGWEHVCRRCKAKAKRGGGEPYSERHPERRDNLRCRNCGMRLWAKPVPRPFRFHDLRHTAATLMILAGGKPHEVQRILRHKSLDTTMRIYAHLFAEDLRPVVNLLPSVPPPVEVAEVVTEPEHVPAEATGTNGHVALLSHFPLLTVREAAAKLRVCITLVYKACERGELQHFRVGSAIRIALEDLEVFRASEEVRR